MSTRDGTTARARTVLMSGPVDAHRLSVAAREHRPTVLSLNYQFNVRGMAPALNTVTVDGGLMASIGTSYRFLQELPADVRPRSR